MPRTLDSLQEAHLAGEVVRLCYLVELDLPDGFVRITTCPFSLVIDGNTYTGAGNLGKISEVTQSTEMRSDSVTLTLSGLNVAYISIARGANYQGRTGKLQMLFMDEDYQPIGDPVPIMTGIIDTMPYKITNQTFEINVVLTNRFSKWENAPDSPRFSDGDQQSKFSGDTFFSRIPNLIAGKEILWGRTNAN